MKKDARCREKKSRNNWELFEKKKKLDMKTGK